MRELYRVAGFEEAPKHVVLATQPDEQRKLFAEALRRNVPGRGGELMNYVEELIEQGRREGRHEGELKGQVRAIEGVVARDIPWSTIEAATGIDEPTFRPPLTAHRPRRLTRAELPSPAQAQVPDGLAVARAQFVAVSRSRFAAYVSGMNW